MKQRVLFLCTGNSCRSQMAEGLVNALWGESLEAFSAGTVPVGSVHPLAVRVMREIDIGLSGQYSKSVDEFRNEAFDLVVTVCDDAAENCPVWLGKGERVHLSLPDPAKAQGSEDEVVQAFRDVRDRLRTELPGYLRRVEKGDIKETRKE